MDFAEKLKEFSTNAIDQPVNKNSKVLLIDGLNSFIRCFASTPTMNDNGEHVGGFTGFLRSVGMVIRIVKPSRCIIVFDGKGGSQKRRAIFSEYKENRKPMTTLNRTYDFNTIDDEIDNRKQQLIQLINALSFLPVTVMSVDNVEADDVLGYLSNLVVERGGESIIMSNDKDFLQLVDDKVKIYSPVKKKIYDMQAVVDEYHIHPHNFIIFRAIDGDKSDNIPGINGIGPATLLKNFPELLNPDPIPWEHIYSRCENLIDDAIATKKKNTACQNILLHKDIINRNVSLMRLDEQHIGTHARIKILDQFDAPISPLNKLSLTQMFVRDRLIGSFNNLDEWLTSTFVPLTRFSTKG